jgi:nitroreductase
MLNCKEILNRHSSRFFDKDKEVSNQIIHKLILAASLAPSGKNLQPWKFFIVNEAKLISELTKILPNNKWISTANLLILVYLDKKESYDDIKDFMAIGACIENMLLEAESNGLSSCWIGECFENRRQIFEIIENDESLELMAIVAFGYEKRRFVKTAKKKVEELVLNYELING